MTSTIRCTGASRWFTTAGGAPVTAVRDVSLSVEPGEFISIQGPSGSGKSTLLGLLGGIDIADEGEVELLGLNLARLSTTERAVLRRSQLGIVFQSFGLVASLSVVENVELPLSLSGVSAVERRRAAEAALDLVGMHPRADAPVDALSGGERQRVGVARALVNMPALLLADEPAGSLDDENAAVVLDLLGRAVRDGGAALVLVTHDPASAARADRCLRMSDGQLDAAS